MCHSVLRLLLMLLALFKCDLLFAESTTGEVDLNLLRLLQSSQETNSQRYQAGKMTLEYEDQNVDLAQRTTVDGEYVWSGSQVFCRVARKVFQSGTDKIKEEELDVRRVQTPRVRYRYEPRYEMMTKMPPEDRRFLRDDDRLLPRERWYRPGIGGTRTFQELLDPSFAQGNVIRYQLSRIDGNLAEAIREYKIGGVMRCVYDLSQEGNLVRYETQPGNLPKDVPSYTLAEYGVFSWLPDSDGHYRLNEMTIEAKQGSQVLRRQHLVISDFDPHPHLSRSQFTEGALGLKTGTIMEDQTKAKHVRYRYGGAAKRPVGDEVLDGLSDTLKLHGFSSPGRGRK